MTGDSDIYQVGGVVIKTAKPKKYNKKQAIETTETRRAKSVTQLVGQRTTSRSKTRVARSQRRERAVARQQVRSTQQQYQGITTAKSSVSTNAPPRAIRSFTRSNTPAIPVKVQDRITSFKNRARAITSDNPPKLVNMIREIRKDFAPLTAQVPVIKERINRIRDKNNDTYNDVIKVSISEKLPYISKGKKGYEDLLNTSNKTISDKNKLIDDNNTDLVSINDRFTKIQPELDTASSRRRIDEDGMNTENDLIKSSKKSVEEDAIPNIDKNGKDLEYDNGRKLIDDIDDLKSEFILKKEPVNALYDDISKSRGNAKDAGDDADASDRIVKKAEDTMKDLSNPDKNNLNNCQREADSITSNTKNLGRSKKDLDTHEVNLKDTIKLKNAKTKEMLEETGGDIGKHKRNMDAGGENLKSLKDLETGATKRRSDIEQSRINKEADINTKNKEIDIQKDALDIADTTHTKNIGKTAEDIKTLDELNGKKGGLLESRNKAESILDLPVLEGNPKLIARRDTLNMDIETNNGKIRSHEDRINNLEKMNTELNTKKMDPNRENIDTKADSIKIKSEQIESINRAKDINEGKISKIKETLGKDTEILNVRRRHEVDVKYVLEADAIKKPVAKVIGKDIDAGVPVKNGINAASDHNTNIIRKNASEKRMPEIDESLGKLLKDKNIIDTKEGGIKTKIAAAEGSAAEATAGGKKALTDKSDALTGSDNAIKGATKAKKNADTLDSEIKTTRSDIPNMKKEIVDPKTPNIDHKPIKDKINNAGDIEITRTRDKDTYDGERNNAKQQINTNGSTNRTTITAKRS